VPPQTSLEIGEVVRVPFGPREAYAFVVTDVRELAEPPAKLRLIASKATTPRAFDATGLALAQWVAEYYLCSLGEALSAVVLGGAIPRAVDRFVPVRDAPPVAANVPERLLRLIWNDLREGFSLEAFLRHADARRAGDRRTLLGYLQTLTRSGDLVRRRVFGGARTKTTLVRTLLPGSGELAGKKSAALVAFVREAGSVRRPDALLAGFSQALIARAIKTGAVHEEQRPVGIERDAVIRLPPFEATREQADAIDAIASALDAGGYAQFLLHGITGSGKTFVYISAIAKVLAEGGRAIVLVPEISLTPQTARRFEDAFGNRVAVLHSALSDRERFDAWQAAARGEIAVVVGARSAIFAPLSDVRLIVVDEAHETSYKQDTAPRYHAVSVARERMRLAGGTLVLGSATPAVDDYARARAGRFPLLRLRKRATDMPLPQTRIVDMAAELEAGNRRIFSSALIEAMTVRIERGEKTVLFVNRRGSGGFILCRSCGYVPNCLRCSTSLAAHRSEGLLRCHYCDAQSKIPELCPQCGGGPVREFGVGTERVVTDVERLFPSARVLRMDSDTTTRVGDHARILDAFEAEGDVLVGTQMVAKGLDFAGVTLVGVIAADIGLHMADYRASERTFGLITQVSGRSGRAVLGEAIVQTYSPTHPAIVFAAQHDYDGFAEVELRDRRITGYPPYSHLVYLGVIGRDQAQTETAVEAYASRLRAEPGWTTLGPAPYPIAKLNNEWRYRIALRAKDIVAMRAFLREVIVPLSRADSTTRLLINVDP
jgi:primosomal protein N' (replication factor Y)